MNEWLKNNGIGLLVGLGAIVGVYTAMDTEIKTTMVRLTYIESSINAIENRLNDHAARLTNNEIVDEKQSVLLESIAKIVERNISYQEDK